MRQKTRENPPTHLEILNWWWDNIETMETKVGWYAYDNMGECIQGYWFCWACGKGVSSKTRLERCHIIPHSIGGNNDTSNYFLMCNECHREAPDTGIETIFFKWLKQRESDGDRLLRGISELCQKYSAESLGITPQELFNRMLEIGMSSHGGKFKNNTTLMTMEYAFEQIIQEKSDETKETFK